MQRSLVRSLPFFFIHDGTRRRLLKVPRLKKNCCLWTKRGRSYQGQSRAYRLQHRQFLRDGLLYGMQPHQW